jgi:hypothetical protein
LSHLVYGNLWNNDLKLMIDPVSEEDARTIYEAGGEVMVAAGRAPLSGVSADSDEEDPEDPEPAEWSLYAELDRGYVEVQFFSFFGTREATYGFDRQPDGLLFLTDVSEYEYERRTMDTGDDDWSTFTQYTFRPDGTSEEVAHVRTADGGEDVRRTERRGADLAEHWEPVPEFGRWDSITRRQR